VTDAADALHQRSLVLTCHDHLFEPSDHDAARRGGVTARIIHTFVDVDIWHDRPEYEATMHQEEGTARRALESFDRQLSYIENHSDTTMLIRTAADIRAARSSGRLGLILGSEGGRLLEGSLELLRCYFRLAVRHIQLNWAYPNLIAACQTDQGEDDTGLTDFGRQLIPEMNRLGMVIDTSHSSHRTRMEAFALSNQPVIHSHAGVDAITPRPQNLTDEELKALAWTGGVMGLHFVSKLVNVRGPDAGQASIDDLCAHIEHVRRVASIETVALGPDWADYSPRFEQTVQLFGFSMVRDLESIDKLPNLTRALLARGYSESDVEAIMGGNLLRVLDSVLPSG
jgi:membrane dipeptidase